MSTADRPLPHRPPSIPANAARDYRDGLKAFDGGDFAAAIGLLGRIDRRAGAAGVLARHYLVRAHIEAARVDLAQSRLGEAEAHLVAARGIEPGASGLTDCLGRCLAAQGRYRDAADAFETVVTQSAVGANCVRDSQPRAASSLRSNTALGTHHVHGSHLVRGSRVQLAPTSRGANLRGSVDTAPSSAIRLALCRWKSGDTTGAVAALEDAARRDPSNAEVRFQLGLMHAHGADYTAAIRCLGEALSLRPNHTEARRHLALTLAAAGRTAEAAEALRAARSLLPRDRVLAYQAAITSPDAPATGAIEVVEAPSPRRGLRATEEGARRQGEGTSQRSTPVDTLTPTLSLQGRGSNSSAESAAAESAAESAVAEPAARLARLAAHFAADPDLIEAFLDLPETPRDAEIFGVLAASAALAVRRHPGFADLHHYAARVEARRGQVQAALDEAHRALAINPNYVQALIHTARLLARTEQYDAAIDRLREAVRSGGDWPDVHYELGELLRRTGRTDPARGAYRRALELKGDYAAARTALEALSAA